MPLNLTQHPCFNSASRQTSGRIHLPVAPKCNIQCNFCSREFDCANESRPGVTSAVLTPQRALQYLDLAVSKAPYLKVVGIAGPGDPFAQPEVTLETLQFIRDKYPEMLLCVATNGLNAAPYVPELARLKVSHVTVTVNAIEPEIGAKIYAWVRDGRSIYRGVAAAQVLLDRQMATIAALKAAGITIKINTIIVPGINDNCVEEIARKMRDMGADIMNCIPLYSVKGTPFEHISSPSHETTTDLRQMAAEYVPQMEHCTRCRADAAGLLGAAQSAELVDIMRACANGQLDAPQPDKPYIAVASMEGILVNQHLGEADFLWIFDPGQGEPKMIDRRQAPESGGGNARWKELVATIHDCHTILVSGIGRTPRSVLEQSGLRVIEMSGLISAGIESVVRTGDVPPAMKKVFQSCGSECQGTGMGCS
jgi:nitrogen fixation protein NifB